MLQGPALDRDSVIRLTGSDARLDYTPPPPPPRNYIWTGAGQAEMSRYLDH